MKLVKNYIIIFKFVLGFALLITLVLSFMNIISNAFFIFLLGVTQIVLGITEYKKSKYSKLMFLYSFTGLTIISISVYLFITY